MMFEMRSHYLLGLLRLGLIVALGLRWITAAARGSSVLRLASPWVDTE